MDQLLTNQESYVERRQLFKNVWETAMHLDEKDNDIMSKPKVIRTLRLNEVDRCVAGKRKKQRIKNLRTVCNKILDFCDRQDADDMFYEQVVSEEATTTPAPQNPVIKPKKLKSNQLKRKIRKIVSCPRKELPHVNSVTPERQDEVSRDLGTMTVRKNSLVRPAMPKVNKKDTETRLVLDDKTKLKPVLDKIKSVMPKNNLPMKRKRQTELSGDCIQRVPFPGTIKFNYIDMPAIVERTPLPNKKLLPIHTVQIK